MKWYMNNRVTFLPASLLGVVLAAVFMLSSVIVRADTADSDNGGSSASIKSDENSLFGGSGGVVEEVDKSKTVSSLQNVMLSGRGVNIGGEYNFSAVSSWMWNTAGKKVGDITFDTLTNPDNESFNTTLNASVYFDGRPDENFRVFGKAEVEYPFTATDTRSINDIFRVKELFSDFNWNDLVFFRGGKQTINWGVGYFFSPADIINLTAIDPENPDAEREGPIALKVNVPIGINNAYLYIIDKNIEKPEDIEIAPKAEFVLGNSEVGFGGVYQKDHAPTAMATVTGSIWDFDIFGEGVVSYGSDTIFVKETSKTLANPFGLETEKVDDKYFLSGTAGFRYSHSDDDGNFNISIAAQYLYNGEGYDNKDILKDNMAGVMQMIGAGLLSSGDIAMPGIHYAASSLMWNGMFNTDLSFSIFWIGNLSDSSGQVMPGISYKVFDKLKAYLKIPFTYGDEGYQYTQNGSTVSVSLELSMGSGAF